MLFYNYNVVTGFEPKDWTIGAIKCYKRGCQCRGCFIEKTYRETLGYGKCSMKVSVRKLILKKGLPKDIYFTEDTEGGL
jgi:hypothetical protein